MKISFSHREMNKGTSTAGKGKRVFCRLLLPVLVRLLSLFSISSFAATQPINTVSIKVKSKLEAGRKIPEEILVEKTSVDDNEIAVSTGGKKYSITKAEWTSGGDTTAKSGETPTMRITLEPEDISKNYFLSSYRSSNVSITGGTFVSATKSKDDLIINLKIDPIKGDYEAPADVFWNDNNLGEIRWTRPDNTSGTYELKLLRDNKNVTTVTSTGLLYNFYPYMTQAGKYKVEMRSIVKDAKEKKYTGNSEWVESTELVITDRDVSDGKGQGGSGGKAQA